MKRIQWWFWLLPIVLLTVGAFRLRFDTDVLALLPERSEVVEGLRRYQEHFAGSQELIITVEADTPEGASHAARTLANRLESRSNLVAEVFWQPPWRESAGSAAELLAFLWLNQPPDVFAALVDRLQEGPVSRLVEDRRERLATSMSPTDFAFGGYDPFGLTEMPGAFPEETTGSGWGEGLFSSADGRFRLLFVEPATSLVDYKSNHAWLEQIRATIMGSPEMDIGRNGAIHLTGSPVFADEISTQMERDLGGSSAGTLLVIALLFWLTHRRIKPLIVLVVMLVGVLGATAAFGGLLFGTLNVVSLGFAAILLGLAEDFGILLYQEVRSHPEQSVEELLRNAAPGIVWSTVTTAGAFMALNLSGLPGLGQLGTLVAGGIVLAAVAMLHAYLPIVSWMRQAPDIGRKHGSDIQERLLLFNMRKSPPAWAAWWATLLIGAIGIAVLARGHLRFDHSSNPLKPRHSEASATLERIQDKLRIGDDALWMVFSGKSETEVAQELDEARPWLEEAVANHLIEGFTLPGSLWPRPDRQKANGAAATALLDRLDELKRVALDAGYSTSALVLTEAMFASWRDQIAAQDKGWLSSRAGRWTIGKVAAKSSDGMMAVGLIRPNGRDPAGEQLASQMPAILKGNDVLLSGWGRLGPAVSALVMSDLPRVLVPVVAIVLASLWLAFRNPVDVAFSLLALAFSGMMLVAAITIMGLSWNLLNLMALPLLLGMGVDFSIHVQLALRRHRGDSSAMLRSVGRALLLAGTTTVAGFVSLGFSSNEGMASLGTTCALGIVSSLLTAVFLLPVWWRAWWCRTGQGWNSASGP